MMTEKECKICKILKPNDSYRKYTNKSDVDSYSQTCKKCLNENDRIRKKNLRQKKQETFIAKCEKCQQDKVLKEFAKLKKFYKRKICNLCYPAFVSEQKNEWCKNESKINMNYRIKKSLAARLRTVLVKNSSTMNYIGCNIQFLREWFEYNFTCDMNWDNYGTYWSIDHIIPVRKFDLTDETEKLQCWNWSNLIPVTVKYNSTKKEIDLEQVTNVLNKLTKFKEEGSTTKWFSEKFILNIELAIIKSKK